MSRPNNNESVKERKDQRQNGQASPKKVILPPGIHEGYDPYNDQSAAQQQPSTTPSIIPPPTNPLEPIESGGGSGNVIPSPLNGIEPMENKQPILQARSPAQNAVFGAAPSQPCTSKPLPPGIKNNNNKPPPFGKNPQAITAPNPISPDILEDNEKAVPIQLEEGLDEQDYFHGLLPREDIETLLRQDGDFVLRVTELRENDKKATRELCLSVYWKANVHHFLIRPNTSKRYQICLPIPGERLPEFENVNKMITHYFEGKIAFSSHQVVLKTPICRQEWELRHKEITCKLKLGSGAFGEVYSGELKRKGKKRVKVAIKMLKGEKVDKKKILEIMGEARVMRPLKHQHVVRCFGVAADMEPLMIVMELINGGALDVYLRCNTNKVSLERRINMTYDAALGLEFVHSKNILHRDIAARNCLYDARVLKVSDFGLSVVGEKHILSANEKAPVRWLAPEVFRTHCYTRPSDVWAYGVLVWEIFNDAQEPYKAWTGTQIRDSVLQVGNKLQMPDWAGPQMAKLLSDVFEQDLNTRISMSEVVKRIEKFAPKRERDEEDEEESQDSSAKTKNNNKGKPNNKATSRLPFKFFQKPKDLPQSDREQQQSERTGKSAQSKVVTLNSAKSFAKPFNKRGSNESTKPSKKGKTKEAFSKFARTTSKDLTLSKESKKKKAAAAGGGSSSKVPRKKTMEQPEKDDSSSKRKVKHSGEKHHRKSKEY